MSQQKQQASVVLLKGNEIQQFDQLLDTIPHGYAKKIIQFINAIQQKRQLENQAENLSSQNLSSQKKESLPGAVDGSKAIETSAKTSEPASDVKTTVVSDSPGPDTKSEA